MNKLLQRQIQKYLPGIDPGAGGIADFIHAVNNSYNAFEKDLTLSAHAFRISEQDYGQINDQLQEEIDTRKAGIRNLKEAIRTIDESADWVDTIEEDGDNLIDMLSYLQDQIAKRKKVETELKDSEYRLSATANRLTQLITNLQNGILVEDEDRKIILANQLFCDMFGVPVPPESLVGMDCSGSAEQSKDLCQQPEAFVARISELLANRQLVTGDELEMKDGRILVRDYVPIYIDNDYKGHLWKYRDITEKKYYENELKRLSMVASANENGVAFCNREGNIFWVNEGFARMTGYATDEMVGKTPLELCKGPLSDRGILRGMVEDFSQGRNFDVEVIHYRKNGTWFWGRVRGQSIPGESTKDLQYFAIIEDITHKKEKEVALQKKEEKYRNIIANMKLGLLEVNNDEIITFTNQEFCNMSGYSSKELIGKKASSLFARGENESLLEKKNALRLKGVSDAYEIELEDKHGAQKWWLISGAPRYDDNGKLVGSIGIHLDISSQKKLEADLIEARESAEESSQAKETFLANMSHEIRTPMNAILGMSRQLQKTDLQPRQKLFLETINSAAENLLVIINDILDISKIEAGKLTLEKIGFSMRDVLSRAKRVMLHKAEEKGLKLNFIVQDAVPPVLLGDPYRLNQVLLNLVSNSIKFTDKGSVSVDCSVEEISAGRQSIRIAVKDTGIGMDSAFLNNLFQKFLQEDKTVARKYGGTGLGMSISKQLVELMGGIIEVHSEKGRGTEIIFQIPLATGSAKDLASPEESPADSTILKGKKILLVEDNELNRLVANTILNTYGALVAEAVDGQEAVEAVRTNVYDLVLMDVQMPVMDGREATRIIRSEYDKNIPIIALTANAIKGEMDICLAAGMNDYLSKPFEEDQLIKLIAYWLGKEIIPTAAKQSAINADALYSLDKIKAIGRGNPRFVRKMTDLFIEQVPASVEEIKKAFAGNQFPVVRSVAHRIKPILDNLSIDTLKEEIKELESLALTDRPCPRMEELIGRLDKVTTKVTEDLKAHLNIL